MRQIIPVYFILVIFLLISCKEQIKEEESEGFTLKGTLTNATNIALFLEELTPSDLILVDSIYTDEEGNFEFSLFIEDAGFYRFGLNSQNFVTLAIEPNQTIIVHAEVQNLPESYKVSGSQGSQILWDLNQFKIVGLNKVDSLRSVFFEAQNKPNFAIKRQELISQYKAVKEQQREFAMNIITNNPHSLASILALYQFFDDKVLLKESEHFHYFQLLSKSLCGSYPTNKHVMELKKRVSEYKRDEEQRQINEKNLAIGMPAPEISLPNPDGQTITLSSLKGKVVLIDFWAAWCPPCRKANIELATVYEEYHNNGFEIYGVSLDRTRDQWLNAIETDNISWTQVSDLRFMNSPVVNLYNVKNIPHNLLLNKNGEILAKDLSVSELHEFLQELL